MKQIAPFFILLAGMLWGTIGFFVRVLDQYGISSMDLVLIRSVITAVLLFVYLAAVDKKLLKIKVKDLWCFLGTGLCSIVFFNYCYFRTITLTSLSVAAVLLYTAPAMVMVMSAFLFHEKITPAKLLALAATFIGCVLVTGISDSTNLNAYGILVGIGSGLGYALYSIFTKFALKRGYHSLTISLYTFAFATVGSFPMTQHRLLKEVCFGSMSTFLFCIAFGVATTVIPYITYNLGLKEMENSKASIIATIEPVTATALGLLVYHETAKWNEIAGIILVITAIVLSNIKSKKDE